MGGPIYEDGTSWRDDERHREEQSFKRALQKVGSLPHTDKRIKPVKAYGSGVDHAALGAGKPYGSR